ncbi:MAG: SDR family oxidoreductase [Planctomycetota bacterium]|jgi:3-oxoacyl-[acyl-carrier protein] reductase
MNRKTVIVSGSSGGIGSEIAYYLAKKKYIVGGCYFTNEEPVKKLKAQFPEYVFPIKMDITDEKNVHSQIEDFVERHNYIGGLINCAGVGGHPEFLIKISKRRTEEVLSVHLTGPICLTGVVLKYMVKQKEGRILNVSSVAAARPMSAQTVYAASKGGIESFTKAVAIEYYKRNIKINCLRLGPIKTKMLNMVGDKSLNELQRKIILGIPQPSDVVDLLYQITFGRASNFLTGQIITFDSGYMIK